MPKKRVSITAREQILIALTYRTLQDSPSSIERVLGFKSQQLERELHEVNGLIPQGLVQVNPNGMLSLTEKGRSDPFVSVMLDTRMIGKILMFLSIALLVHFEVGWLLGLVITREFSYMISEGGLIIFLLIIGWFLMNYPWLLLTRIKRGTRTK